MACQNPIDKATYYHISSLADAEGGFSFWYTTQWAAEVEGKPFRHLYVARPVLPTKLKFLEEIGQPGCLVNTEQDYAIYDAFIGGHAIIEESIAQKFVSEIFDPVEKVFSYTRGDTAVTDLPSHFFNRAPGKKIRMEVLKRDGFRCKACGRSPKDYVDIELHVHHIVPWGEGGVTEEDNLITLCMTCHTGLDPHYEPKLFELINKTPSQDIKYRRSSEEYHEGRKNYQIHMAHLIQTLRKPCDGEDLDN